MRVKDKVIIVTGSGGGIGEGIAKRLAEQGGKVIVNDINAALGEKVVADITRAGGTASFFAADVTKSADVKALVDAAVQRHGRLDVMINNAGVAVYGPLEGMGQNEIDLMVDTNLKGTLFGSLAAYRVMKERRSGIILNISSVAGKLHLPNEAVYGATKWAINGFSGALRLEAMAHDVRVSTVCPGGINTPFWREQEFLPFPEHLDPAEDFLDPDAVAKLVVEVVLQPARVVIPELVVLPMLR